MKQTTILNMSVLLVLAAAANAQQPDEERPCSNETLKGSYGGVISGTRPAPSVIPGGPGVQGQLEQTVGLILWVFDGKGGFTQSISGKGTISGPGLDVPVSGTYSVNANCTATVKSIIPGVPAERDPDGDSGPRKGVSNLCSVSATGYGRGSRPQGQLVCRLVRLCSAVQII